MEHKLTKTELAIIKNSCQPMLNGLTALMECKTYEEVKIAGEAIDKVMDKLEAQGEEEAMETLMVKIHDKLEEIPTP